MSTIIKSPEDGSAQRKRAYWRSRRGMTELEQILLPFVMAQYDGLTEAQQATYNRMLECEDWDVFDWLQGRAEAPDAALRDLVSIIAGSLAAGD